VIGIVVSVGEVQGAAVRHVSLLASLAVPSWVVKATDELNPLLPDLVTVKTTVCPPLVSAWVTSLIEEDHR
jgi:hypothetical protein